MAFAYFPFPVEAPPEEEEEENGKTEEAEAKPEKMETDQG